MARDAGPAALRDHATRDRAVGPHRDLRRAREEGLPDPDLLVDALAVWLASGATAESRQIPLGGTGSAQTGDFTPSAGDVTQDEFPTGGESDQGPNPYNGTISFSTGAGGGPSVNSGKKAKSNP